jgi:hypothetical protein
VRNGQDTGLCSAQGPVLEQANSLSLEREAIRGSSRQDVPGQTSSMVNPLFARLGAVH